MKVRITAKDTVLAALLTFGPPPAVAQPSADQVVRSPSGQLSLSFRLTDEGAPVYALAFGGRPVVRESRLGIEIKEGAPLLDRFAIEKVDTRWWTRRGSPSGAKSVGSGATTARPRSRCGSAGEEGRSLVLRFRVFDDGLGFRYEFPEQKVLDYFIVSDEKTQFNMTGDHMAFWIPGDYDTNEYPYSTSRLSEIDAMVQALGDGIAVQARIAPNAVQTPLMMKTADGLYVSVHEAALVSYPAMNLLVDRGLTGWSRTSCPTPSATRPICKRRIPHALAHHGGERQGGGHPGLQADSEPERALEDRGPSLIKPQKYVGVWWEMHVGKATWNYAELDSVKLAGTDWRSLKPNGRHGANTANVKRYIDFAAAARLRRRARRRLERGLGGLVRATGRKRSSTS